MFKDKILLIRDYIIKNSTIIFPVIVVLAVAVTVSFALGAASGRKVKDIAPESQEESGSLGTIDDVPLVKNEDNAISELIYAVYNAEANGDLETLKSLCDEISDLDLLSFQEKANYIEYYPFLEIYTKKGMNEGETIVYVYYKMIFVNHEEEFPGYKSHYICTADDGSLYLKRNNFSDELNNYIEAVCDQDDVREFNNRVNVEYANFKEEHPELADYPEEVMTQVNMTVGVKWSEIQAAAESEENEETDENGEETPDPEPAGPVFATATTTVNVRSSDSEQADKLGKVSGGTRIEVLEQRVNGWSKVLYNNKEGFIKSEFLQVEESAEGLQTTGKVKASTTVNVRSSASESGAKLGVLAGGDMADLIAVEGDWCKIKYNGQAAYVKAEFVEVQ